jgi:hypothetical protein
MITRRLADDGVLAIFTRSLRRPTIARPEALARVASPGQAQLQIFDLALIPIVGIRPRINHMKLNEHTRRLLFIALGLPVLQLDGLLVYKYTASRPGPPKTDQQ